MKKIQKIFTLGFLIIFLSLSFAKAQTKSTTPVKNDVEGLSELKDDYNYVDFKDGLDSYPGTSLLGKESIWKA